MRAVSAQSGLDRSSNATKNRPKSNVDRSRQVAVPIMQLPNAFCRLTPELSRAERGGWEPVLPACPQVSTKPRHGVGLNDLLGGKEAGEVETPANLPKGRSPEAGTRPVRLELDVSEATASVADRLAAPITVSEAG